MLRILRRLTDLGIESGLGTLDTARERSVNLFVFGMTLLSLSSFPVVLLTASSELVELSMAANLSFLVCCGILIKGKRVFGKTIFLVATSSFTVYVQTQLGPFNELLYSQLLYLPLIGFCFLRTERQHQVFSFLFYGIGFFVTHIPHLS